MPKRRRSSTELNEEQLATKIKIEPQEWAPSHLTVGSALKPPSDAQDTAKRDAFKGPVSYRSEENSSFFGKKREQCDLTIRCSAGRDVGDQNFHVESSMIYPYENFWNLVQRSRISKPGEPVVAQLNVAPKMLKHILRAIAHHDQAFVIDLFDGNSFGLGLSIHIFCHRLSMVDLACKARARFVTQANFVLSEYCGSGTELERNLLISLPWILKCNSFARDEATFKHVDRGLFNEVKYLFYIYRDRIFKDSDRFIAFLRSCPGLAEEMACDMVRDEVPTRRLTCPRCAGRIYGLLGPGNQARCSSCMTFISLEPLSVGEGGEDELCMKIENRSNVSAAARARRNKRVTSERRPMSDAPPEMRGIAIQRMQENRSIDQDQRAGRRDPTQDLPAPSIAHRPQSLVASEATKATVFPQAPSAPGVNHPSRVSRVANARSYVANPRKADQASQPGARRPLTNILADNPPGTMLKQNSRSEYQQCEYCARKGVKKVFLNANWLQKHHWKEHESNGERLS